MNQLSRRDALKKGAAAVGAASVLLGPGALVSAKAPAPANQSGARRLAEVGWVWDGQAINGQWFLSIFGTGEGARWFGVKNVCHMFHENTAMAMEKLRDFREVVCEISKWKYHRYEQGERKGLGSPMFHDRPAPRCGCVDQRFHKIKLNRRRPRCQDLSCNRLMNPSALRRPAVVSSLGGPVRLTSIGRCW